MMKKSEANLMFHLNRTLVYDYRVLAIELINLASDGNKFNEIRSLNHNWGHVHSLRHLRVLDTSHVIWRQTGKKTHVNHYNKHLANVLHTSVDYNRLSLSNSSSTFLGFLR
jgi:hypothetical protein